MPSLTVKQIAVLCQSVVEGESELLITGANSLEGASESELSFVGNQKAESLAQRSSAGCLLVTHSFEQSGSWSLIRVNDPRLSFVSVLGDLYPPKASNRSVHPTATIAASAILGEGCSIGPNVSIGEDTRIGPNCTLGNGCTIEDGVSIGAHTTLHANVTLYERTRIGSRVILHAGCRIGADGFGFTLVRDHYEKFPQVGIVDIGNDVEIGANTCIDRAALGITSIGEGSKVDNLVHIAHNCTIGKHVVIAAQAGLSGGITVGDYAFIGGQTGIGDKARIEANAVVAAKSGILTGQRIKAGEPVWGIPARPLRQHLKNLANIGKLSAMREELKVLQMRIKELERAREVN